MAFQIAETYVDLSLKGVESVKQGLGGVKGMLGGLGITPATLGIVGLGGAIAYAVKRGMDWEAANEALKGKLQSIGENAEQAMGKINALAGSISSVTTKSKGDVKELILLALNMGATAAEAEKLATTAIGAGKATGQSAEAVLEGMVKIQHGMRNALDRSSPAVAAAGTQQEKLAALAKLAAQGYQQFSSELGVSSQELAAHTRLLETQAAQMGVSSSQGKEMASAALGIAQRTGQSAETVLKGLVAMSKGTANALDKTIPGLKGVGSAGEKMAILSKLAAEGQKELRESTGTAKAQMEKLMQTVGGLYTELGVSLLPIIEAVIGVISDMVDWVKSTIQTIKDFAGANDAAGKDFQRVWGEVGKFFQEIAAYIGKICSWIIKQFMLIPAYGELIGISFMNLFCNLLPAYMTAFGKNFIVLGKWMLENWKGILITMATFQNKILSNMIDNAMALWTGLLNFISGKGFHVKWKGLTDGVFDAIKTTPQWIKAQTDPMWDQMQREALAKVNKQSEAIEGLQKKNQMTAEKKGEQTAQAKTEIGQMVAEGLKPIENIKEKNNKSDTKGMSGVLDIWKNAQQALTKNTEKEHLSVAKQQLKEQRDANRLMKSIAEKRGGNNLSLAK